MNLTIRQRLYLLFGVQLVGFVGLFCFLYAYIIPSIKHLERESHKNAQLIKDVSHVQLLVNCYFEGNASFETVKSQTTKLLQHLPEESIKSTLKNILKKLEQVKLLSEKNRSLHKQLFQMLDKSIEASNNYINQVSYRLEDKRKRKNVTNLERMVLRLAVVNTQTNNDIKRLFLGLYSDINKVSDLYKLIDDAIVNAEKAKELLKGSPLVVLPINAIKSDIKAKEIVKRFESNTRKKAELEKEIRKSFNEIVFKLSTNTASVVSKIGNYVYLVNGLVVILAIVSALLIYSIIKSMSAAISEFEAKLPKIAEGDLNHTLAVRNKDEFGEICNLFNRFISKLKDNLKEIMRKQSEFISASQRLADSTNAVTKINLDIISEIKDISEDSSRIKDEAGKLVSNIEQLKNTIEEVHERVSAMAKEVDTVSGTVNSTNSVMERLNASAQEIGDILKMINEITDQINLLALNATIEAARAGDAGKGFAVVANEIKDLANETTKATDYIKEKISAIQESSKATFDKIAHVSSIVEEFARSFDSITEISKEQKVSAEDAYANVENTAQHLSKIDANISVLSKRIKEIEDNIRNAKNFISRIDTMVESTRNTISQFKLD